jgi:hypothetical protein
MNCNSCGTDLGPRIEVSMSLFIMHEWNLHISGDLPADIYYELKQDNELYFKDGVFIQGMGGAIEPFKQLRHAMGIIQKIRKATSDFSNKTKVRIIFNIDNKMTIKEEYPDSRVFSSSDGDTGTPIENEISYWALLEDYLSKKENENPQPKFVPSLQKVVEPTAPKRDKKGRFKGKK